MSPTHGNVEERVDLHNDKDDDDAATNSSDEALLDMLGLTSLESLPTQAEAMTSPLPIVSDDKLQDLVQTFQDKYQSESYAVFPWELSVSAEHMRQLTEALVWGGESVQADRTYETVSLYKDGQVFPKKSLTRLEHFVDAHDGWSALCHEYLPRILSAAMGVEMVLYKEKLNLKPPGGSGFAPHLDTPSLRVALGAEGPQQFCTVMVAIDDMTKENGCLRICPGPWGEQHCVETIAPEANGNPDAGGRAGAIPTEIAQELDFVDILCKGGTIVAFNGWAPHRSAANVSPFPRRAVFLTYNPKIEGDFHKRYYQRMDEIRQEWRESVGLANRKQREEDQRLELEALATVPT